MPYMLRRTFSIIWWTFSLISKEKNKNNLKSRLDLVDIVLEMIFMLMCMGKVILPFIDWIHLRRKSSFIELYTKLNFQMGMHLTCNCVDKSEWKFIAMKSHNFHATMKCHICLPFLDCFHKMFMQQLQVSFFFCSNFNFSFTNSW